MLRADRSSGDRRGARSGGAAPWRGLACAAVVAVLALTACSALSPQAVTDPFGLDGQQVEVTFPVPLTAQAIAGDGSTTFSFPDLEQPLPLAPGQLSNTVKLAPTVRLSGPAGSDTITITDPVLTVRLWHGADSYEEAAAGDRVEMVLAASATIVYANPTCFSGTFCEYSYQSGLRTLGDLTLKGSELSTVLGIMTDPPSPNGGSAMLALEGSPVELAGRTLRLTLDAAQGEVRF